MIIAFAPLSLWSKLIDLILHLAVGAGLGCLYFCAIRQTAATFVGHTARAVTLTTSRFVLLACILAAVAFEGAMPLLSTALGILLVRPGLFWSYR